MRGVDGLLCPLPASWPNYKDGRSPLLPSQPCGALPLPPARPPSPRREERETPGLQPRGSAPAGASPGPADGPEGVAGLARGRGLAAAVGRPGWGRRGEPPAPRREAGCRPGVESWISGRQLGAGVCGREGEGGIRRLPKPPGEEGGGRNPSETLCLLTPSCLLLPSGV